MAPFAASSSNVHVSRAADKIRRRLLRTWLLSWRPPRLTMSKAIP